MPLELQPWTAEDIEPTVEIQWQAFKDDIMGVMYPHGFTDAARKHTERTAVEAWRKDPESLKRFKVVDTDLPADDPYKQIVGTAWWKFYYHDRTLEEIQKESEKRNDETIPDIDEEFFKNFVDALKRASMQYLGGKAHIELHILDTHPKHHRRGVGSMHLRWGIEQADKLGLPIYLNASPIGKPLYERMGFETVGWLDCDFTKAINGKPLPHACMIRWPKKPGTTTVPNNIEKSEITL